MASGRLGTRVLISPCSVCGVRVGHLDHPEAVQEGQVLAQHALVESAGIAGAGAVAGRDHPELRMRADHLAAVGGDHQGRPLDDVVEAGELGGVHDVHLVQDEQVAVARRHGQGSVHEAGLALDQHELTDQIRELHAPVAGHLLHRPVEPGGDLEHQGGLAGPGRAGQQQAVSRRVGEEGQHVAQVLPEDVGPLHGDLRMGRVGEALHGQAPGGLHAEGLGHDETVGLGHRCLLGFAHGETRHPVGEEVSPGRGFDQRL